MTTYKFAHSLLRRRVSCRHALSAALLALIFSASATAASVPDRWWVDVINDRGSQVRQQLARGADPNALDADELPTLMLAIRSEAWDVYDALLADRRIRVEIENKHRETPLMYLALLGETERAVALIKRGAQVNRLGWTPLHYAASRGQTDTARMLLDRGAIVNAPAPDGTTPLMMAAYSGNGEVMQLLLDRGADPSVRNLQKQTAADWARSRRHTRLADELEQVAERTAAQREGRPLPAPVAPEPEPQTGTSRYFDLERFERNED